ncbi:hypothetical protein, conserved [Eimeria brunetti]|uniref:Uncharacterized protein n=1 Tax=Eimeria brunetti TaxID=51314 RepID=U6LP60_9EIME|nr:hypothetical protein, conserved [Eimeria brunetti]
MIAAVETPEAAAAAAAAAEAAAAAAGAVTPAPSLSPQPQVSGVCAAPEDSGVSAAAAEYSFSNYRFIRQYISPGEAVDVAAQPRGAGPWLSAPIFNYSFQSSKPNVRVTIAPRQGHTIEYSVVSSADGNIQRFKAAEHVSQRLSSKERELQQQQQQQQQQREVARRQRNH